ncbi:hypothetical protein PIB30_070255 [Stylosanthes scabra]|uniref:Uncharacterized protein n=1 Tax=Stylosanthes scabra TaxID=79078 RepID=A0ABU6WRF8_9FABA|nr:hypothetical protein [Stylosanthes scabra]
MEMDRNTKYFHGIAKVKRMGKVMEKVKIDGTLFSGPSSVKREVWNFFRRLYSEDQHINIDFDSNLVRKISVEDVSAVWRGCRQRRRLRKQFGIVSHLEPREAN